MQNLEFGTLENFRSQIEAVLKRRKERVTLDHPLDEREVEIRTERQRLLINLRAAANENLAPGHCGIRGIELAQIGHGQHAGYWFPRTREHNRRAIGQRLAERLERFAPHDDDLPS